jgi:hypothetical protein
MKNGNSNRLASSSTDPWVADVEKSMAEFAAKHGVAYQFSDRQLAAAFEIGCFLLLAKDYENQKLVVSVQNLIEQQFRYLTTPSGNPRNFSYLKILVGKATYEFRQQVRVRSHIDPDIFFTPDMVLLDGDAAIEQAKDADYASGKRRFFVVESKHVVAAHECKSMTGFPELYVSFLGMAMTAHSWFANQDRGTIVEGPLGHLAPTLFVGGEASNLHRRMIAALQKAFPLNIVTGIYKGGWVLTKRSATVRRLPLPVGVADRARIPRVIADSDIPF